MSMELPKIVSRDEWLVHFGVNEPIVVTLPAPVAQAQVSGAKSLGAIGGMLRCAQHDKPLVDFRHAVLAGRVADAGRGRLIYGRFGFLPSAIRNITLLPWAWGEKNSVTASSKKVRPVAPNPRA